HAFWTGCEAFGERPSIVTILSVGFTLPTGSEQERTSPPLRCTEQAPHCATPHPYFVPVSPACSRMTQSRGVSGSTCTSRTLPLMFSFAMRPSGSSSARTLSPAAGHRERVAGDVARLVGGEEENGVSDLEGLAEPPERRHVIGAVLDGLVELLETGAEALGVDGPGRHSVHGDAVLGELEGDVPHEAVHAGLCRRIGGAARVVGRPRRALACARR